MKHKEEKYPREEDIRDHKNRIWTALIQYYAGYVSFENVKMVFRSLMGDASLWVNNNHKKIDLEKVKKEIANLRMETDE